MTRRGLREQIFKLLFRAEFNTPDEMPEQEKLFFESRDLTVTPEDQAYITEKVGKILTEIPAMDEKLEKAIEGWSLNRIGKVELTILRLALYEIEKDADVPAQVAVSEAIDLAKKFGQDNAGAFINGVLAKFMPEQET
ncbi:MAG: transcription antitermination factor NusB [Lachnospiraceae bacterium]|nr:transcription antitermination factor NusB [Lachnospiraceae bacterium]